MATSREVLGTTGDGDKHITLKKCIMANVIKWKKNWLLLCGVILGFLLFYMLSLLNAAEVFRNPTHCNLQLHGYSIWPEFHHKSLIDGVFFKTHCIHNVNYSITGLVDMSIQWSKTKNSLCRNVYDKFKSIFTLEARMAPLNLPPPFKEKVSGWLGHKKELVSEVYNQVVIHVISEYTREHTIFNPLRDKRPKEPPSQSQDIYYDELIKNTAETCDFCKFKNFTAEDVFGRVESKHSFSSSNVFKIDTLHGLMALKKHDPLAWTLEEFLDLFKLTDTWLKKAHAYYQKSRYPALVWDVLPKCGASQVHPHLHVFLDNERHHGEIEVWRKGAQEYFDVHNSNYFTDLVSVYSAINLTATYGKAVAFASLVPRKDHEVVVMAQEADEDFYTLLYFVLRAFIDDLHNKCFSMGIGLPAIDVSKGKIPAYARAITRGFLTDLRADMSSLELFTATNVNIDPYKTIDVVRNSVRTRAGTSH